MKKKKATAKKSVTKKKVVKKPTKKVIINDSTLVQYSIFSYHRSDPDKNKKYKHLEDVTLEKVVDPIEWLQDHYRSKLGLGLSSQVDFSVIINEHRYLNMNVLSSPTEFIIAKLDTTTPNAEVSVPRIPQEEIKSAIKEQYRILTKEKGVKSSSAFDQLAKIFNKKPLTVRSYVYMK